MGRLLLGLQQVELVGGEGWLEQNSVAIAAISAALIAALVSVLNRRAQLGHDRYLRNRDYVRDALDSAATVGNEVRTAVDRFVIAVRSLEDHRGEMNPSRAKAEIEARNAERDELLNKLQSMRAARSRLEIRLEDSEAALSAYVATLNAFVDVSKGVHRGIVTNRPEDQRLEDQQREDAAEAYFSEFQVACRTWFGKDF